MVIQPGDKYWTLPTPLNAKNEIPADKSCWVAYVDGAAISVRVPLSGTEIQVKVPRALFGQNFRPDPYGSPNAGYVASAHFVREFR